MNEDHTVSDSIYTKCSEWANTQTGENWLMPRDGRRRNEVDT